jgi:hypothetical protein
LSQTLSPFCFSYFSDKALCFHPGNSLRSLPRSASAYLELKACTTMPSLLTFCPGWPWATILPNFASLVAGIGGLHHYT